MTWDYSFGDVITIVFIMATVYFHYTRIVLRMDKIEKIAEGKFDDISNSLRILESRLKSAEDHKSNLAERVARVEEWREDHDVTARHREDLITQHGQILAKNSDMIFMLDKRLSRWEEILMRREEDRSKHA